MLALQGDPTWSAGAAPVSQWSRMCWKAIKDDDRDVTISDMAQAWSTAREELDCLVTHDDRRRWELVRGPVGATYLTLHRMGWWSSDGRTVVDDKGFSRRFEDFSPTMWKSFVKDAIQRKHETDLGIKTGHAEVRGARVCVDVL